MQSSVIIQLRAYKIQLVKVYKKNRNKEVAKVQQINENNQKGVNGMSLRFIVPQFYKYSIMSECNPY